MTTQLIRPILILAIPVVVYVVLVNVGVDALIARNWLFFLLIVGIGGFLVLFFLDPTRDVDPRWQRLASQVAVPIVYVLLVSRLFDTSQGLYPAERLVHAGFYVALFLGMTILLVMGRPERTGPLSLSS